jgi:hypothetical protein
MRRLAVAAIFAFVLCQPAFADVSCTPTKPILQQNRTRMKHRNPPSQNPGMHQTTVAQMAAFPAASGVTVAGFRTSQQPIDPHELSVVTLKGDLWAINIEPDDCDFHLEISDVGESNGADRVIVEIPQGPRFTAARNKLIQIVHDSGVALSKRIRFQQPVRVQVFGFLFFDAWHYSTTKPRGNNHGSAQVASIWEIHPVWAIIQAS